MFKAETTPEGREDDDLKLDDETEGDDQLEQDGLEDGQTDDDQADSEGDAEKDDDEFEIALDGDEGSHPEKDDDRGIRKRINKLNAKVEAEREGKSEAEERARIAEERARLYELALADARGEKPKDGAPPDPNDYDDGIADPKYIKAFQDHIAAGIMEKAQATQTQTQTETEQQGKLYARQKEHYQRADKLKVKDYDDTEDKALAILGKDTVNQLISNSDKSAEILYYLGKNQGKAEDLASLVKQNPVKAVLELGRLEARLVSRPKSKSKPAPDPDGELRGGGAGRKKAERGPKGATFE